MKLNSALHVMQNIWNFEEKNGLTFQIQIKKGLYGKVFSIEDETGERVASKEFF